jgi:hypothetical protein
VGEGSASKKRKQRCWKVQKEKPRLVIGVDVSLDEIPDVFVGIWFPHHRCKNG